VHSLLASRFLILCWTLTHHISGNLDIRQVYDSISAVHGRGFVPHDAHAERLRKAGIAHVAVRAATHVMKKQAHTESFRQNNQVLAIFYGPSTYVSASWYENKKVASTWNYQAVHAKGLLRFLDDQGLKEVLTRLTDKFENNSLSPALVQKMDNEYLTKMMQAIVAFEIELTDVQHVFKLSQNRDERSHANIIQKLKEKGGDAEIIAKTMENDAGTIFGSKEEGRP